MIFKIIQSPITNFQKPKNIQSENAKYTKKSESNFFDNAHHTPLQNWVVSVLKKCIRSRLADNIFTAKPRYAQGLLRYDNACFNDYADN